jgi:imidazolonepropionase-like amidohydrolase
MTRATILRCTLALGMACSLVSAAADNSVLIRNVTIHPVTAPDIPNGSVLVVDGKIDQIGSSVSSRPGVRTLDGQGLHLYPGLINAATNIGLEEIEAIRDTVDLDEIGAFNPDLRAAIAFNPSSEHIAVTRAAGITTVLALPGSGVRPRRGETPLISGQSALMHLDGWTWEQMAVRPSAVMDVLFPEIESIPPQYAAFLAAPGRTFADQQREHREELRQLREFLEQARRYQKARNANLPGFKRDIRLEAMGPVIDGTQPLFLRASRDQAIKDAVQFADDEKVKIILAGPDEIGSTGPLLKARGIPVVLGQTLALPMHDDDPYDAPYTLPKRFFDAGVKICFGTFDVQFARNVAFQAAQAVAFGLPHEEALRALTINSAEILGAGDQIGSIEKGKSADLILTDGDPMEARTSIRQMFIAGKEVELTSRHTREFEKWMARP